MRYTKGFFLCFVMLSALSAHARAQGSGADDRQRMVDGLRAFKSGDYAQAVRLLSEDLSVHPWPTVAYYAGLAYERSGKLVEAAELYRRAAVLAPPGTGEELQLEQKAQSDAAAHLAALEPRIPRLTLRIEPATSQGVTVTLDEADVPLDALQAPLLLNPGSHQVGATAQCGERDATTLQTVTLAERQSETLDLKLDCPERSEPPLGSPPPWRPTPPVSPPPREPPRSVLWRTLGWVGIGVGGASLLASGVTAVAGESIRADACNDRNECPWDKKDDYDTYESLRTWSTVTFYAGLPLLTAGVGALVWDRYQQAHAPKDQGITAWVGFGSVGLSGRFE